VVQVELTAVIQQEQADWFKGAAAVREFKPTNEINAVTRVAHSSNPASLRPESDTHRSGEPGVEVLGRVFFFFFASLMESDCFRCEELGRLFVRGRSSEGLGDERVFPANFGPS